MAKKNFLDLITNLEKKGIKTILISDVPMLKQNVHRNICEFQNKVFKYNYKINNEIIYILDTT